MSQIDFETNHDPKLFDTLRLNDALINFRAQFVFLFLCTISFTAIYFYFSKITTLNFSWIILLNILLLLGCIASQLIITRNDNDKVKRIFIYSYTIISSIGMYFILFSLDFDHIGNNPNLIIILSIYYIITQVSTLFFLTYYGFVAQTYR